MKYLCLIYLDEKRLDELPDEDCVDFDTAVRKSGHCIASEALESVRTASTVRVRNGNVSVTDGPFAETKEQLAGFYMIEAKDLHEAIQLAVKIPPAQVGSVEIRAVRPIRETVAGRGPAAREPLIVVIGCPFEQCARGRLTGDEMKYVCLGYIEPGKFENMPERERNAMVDGCFAYDDVLRREGHFAGGEALQPSNTAVTLRFQGGKVMVTDGPYAETKEQIGGILVLEAEDLDHAVRLMSKHPGVRVGPFEIRSAADLGEMIRESEVRRLAAKG